MSPTTRRRPALHCPSAEGSTRNDSADEHLELAPTFAGRLAFPTGHGPRSAIVECYRAAGGITIALPEFNDAANYLTDTPVALSSVWGDDLDPAPAIIGHSRMLPDREVDADAIAALERWPAGIHARYFHITPSPPNMSDHEDRRFQGRRTHRLAQTKPPTDTPVRADIRIRDGRAPEGKPSLPVTVER